LLFRPARIAPEIGQRAKVARILGHHAERRLGRWPAAIFHRGQRHHDLLAHAALVQIGDGAAMHETVRQVIDEITDPLQPQLFERTGQVRPYTFEAIGLDKQGVEQIGTHAQAISAWNKTCHSSICRARFDLAHGMARQIGLVPLPADNTGRIKETKMLLPHGTVIAVIDARNFRLFRNAGDEASPELAETDAPRLDTHNHSGGSHHGSTITMAHDAHATAAIEYLAQEVQSRRIEHLVVIAARAALANCARPIPRAGGRAAG
jgi:protein required for attachment to host cells